MGTPAADAIVDPKALARTYNSPTHDDAWQAVEEYQHVMNVAAEHPNKGSGALSSLVDLPRSRIRGWVDSDGMPDPARAVQVADEHGWLLRDPETPAGRAFAGCIAWILSGGAISDQTYAPYFTINRQHPDSSRRDLHALAASLDLTLRENEREANRATELVVSEHGSVFGRCLAVAGAPVGRKVSTSVTIPQWIRDGDQRIREVFSYVYLNNRAVSAGDGDVLQLQETNRPDRYYQQLAVLFEAVAGTGTVTGRRNHVRANQTATAALRRLIDQNLEAMLAVDVDGS